MDFSTEAGVADVWLRLPLTHCEMCEPLAIAQLHSYKCIKNAYKIVKMSNKLLSIDLNISLFKKHHRFRRQFAPVLVSGFNSQHRCLNGDLTMRSPWQITCYSRLMTSGDSPPPKLATLPGRNSKLLQGWSLSSLCTILKPVKLLASHQPQNKTLALFFISPTEFCKGIYSDWYTIRNIK